MGECGRPDSAFLENALFSSGDSPRSGFRQMTGLPVGRCPNCGAAVSYFAWSCPNCHRRNLPNPVAATAAVVTVLVAGGLAVLGWHGLRSEQAPDPQAQAGAAPGAANPGGEKADDYGWIVQAMADCDVAAKHKLDTLHFLIIPVTSTAVSLLSLIHI